LVIKAKIVQGLTSLFNKNGIPIRYQIVRPYWRVYTKMI
jgi:hypothetical protein